MGGFDYLLIGAGIIGLLLTGVAVFGKRPASETASIGAGSLGALCIGLGGLGDATWLMIAGIVILLGSFWLEWYFRQHPSGPGEQLKGIKDDSNSEP